MRSCYLLLVVLLTGLSASVCLAQDRIDRIDTVRYKVYPEVNSHRPDLSSPFVDADGIEWVVAVTKDDMYAIIPVNPTNERGICKQLVIDSEDFPELATTGLHSAERLSEMNSITGRSLEEITRLGRPDGLSTDGFMAEDETILSVLLADNETVSKLGLTHPQLAKPLFHVLNMMDTDLTIGRWNMSIHQWENIRYFFYNGKTVHVEAYDTKGGQKSIFDDDLEGAFSIKLWRDLEEEELEYLRIRYADIPKPTFDEFVSLLSSLNTGELEPQYIMRYGFYEGHTSWRTDPVTVSFIFGIKSLAEIESTFTGKLDELLTLHFTDDVEL